MHERSGCRMAVPRWVTAAVFVGAALTAHAAAPEAAPESAFLADLPVVISASRMPQSLADTPGAMTIIDRALIRESGYRSITQLLRLVPGMAWAQERGHLTHLAYHGLGGSYPNQMQVLIDGRSVYTPFFLGGVDWTSLPITIEEIERIEVLRGSNSATYGSNAFKGVVNIVTRHGAQDRGGALWLGSGPRDALDAGIRYGGRVGDLDYRVIGQYAHDEGLNALFDNAGSAILTLRGDYRLGAGSEITLLAGVHQGRRGFGLPNTPSNNGGLRDEKDGNSYVNLRWRRQLESDSELALRYYRNIERVRHSWSVYLPPLFPVVPIDFDRFSTRDNLEFEHSLRPSQRTRLVWGGELRSDRLESERMFALTKTEVQRLMRMFGNLEVRPSSALTLNAALTLERYQRKSATLAPRLFANWHLDPQHTIRAGFSRAYRAPSLFEERGDLRYVAPGGATLLQTFIGSSSIGPERIDGVELGYFGRFARGTADLRLYSDRLEGFVGAPGIRSTLVPAPLLSTNTAQFVNAFPLIKLRGIEAQLRARPWRDGELLWGIAHTKILAPVTQLERSAPRDTQSLTWLQRYPGNVSSTVTMYRVGAFQWGGGAPRVEPHTVFDLRLAVRTRLGETPVEVALVLLNQGPPHEEYTQVATGTPALITRSFMATVRLGL